MRPVLGFRLELVPDDNLSPCDGATWFSNYWTEWVRSWYDGRGIPIPPGTALGDSGTLPHAHRYSSVRESPTDGMVLEQATWQYPADGDRSALWTSRATIAADDTGADLTLSLDITSIEFVARPFRYDVYVPRLVRELARTGRIHIAGRPISAAPRALGVGAVPAFVEADLRSPNRKLPIVLVARVKGSDGLCVDPGRLARDLCGLAEVWVLNDRWTAYALSDTLGPRLSCFDGGVRTYWPGFDPADDPFTHPLITLRRLEDLQHNGVDIGRHLVRHLAPVGALRLAESVRERVVREALREVGRSHAKAAVRASAAAGKVEELEKQILSAWEKHYELEEDLDRQRQRAERAEEQLQAVKENFALVSAMGTALDTEEPTPTDAAPILASVSDALRLAAEANPVLLVWRSASDSAAASRFARPEQVVRALEAIAEVGALYFRQQRTRVALGNLEDQFASRGCVYAPSDHQTTITRYGKERTFTEDGRTLLFERHLTLGGGDRQNCLQIYFEFNAGAERIDIGYCGVHLPYAGMRS